MGMTIPFAVVAGRPALLGESPAYDGRHDRLVWTDMFGKEVRELLWADGDGWRPGRSWQVGDLATAVVPRAGGGLVVLTRTEVLGLSDEGERAPIAALDEGSGGIRFNDAKCDRDGALVAGWMAEALDRPGAVVRVDPAGGMQTLVDEVHLANGMDWSPDGSVFYLVDSARLTVEAFDYHPESALGGRRTVITLERGQGAPNGITADDEGCLWIAITYGGQVRRYSPEAELLEVHETPVKRVTSCAFGGPHHDDLFVTSGSFKPPSHVPNRVGLDAGLVDAANHEPLAGALFVGRPRVTGPAAVPFAG